MEKTGRLIRMDRIYRHHLRDNPDVFFAFGDNMARAGYGGQAKQMRGEANAIGIPTKWGPMTLENAYFSNEAWGDQKVKNAIMAAFDDLETALRRGLDVVVPADGIGTGLAELPERAPMIADYINLRMQVLEDIASSIENLRGTECPTGMS